MPRERSIKILDNLREYGVSDTEILEYLIYNYLSGGEAQDAMESAQDEFVTNGNFSV